jgi:lysophospholipase L1-like esterase
MSDVLTSSHQSSGDEQELTRIYVIGDSHTQVFGGSKLFTVCPIGPATAYNLKTENSLTNSNQKLLDIVKNINKFNDIVILVFGEIDCRIHIYYKYLINDKTISISELIDHTISNYGAVLKQLRDMNIFFCVYGIPAAGFEENIYKYQFYASPERRSKIYKEFNDKLKTFCEKNKYEYINIYPIVSDENGFLRKEYAADDVHLNERIIPFIESWLSKEFNSEMHIGFLGRCPSIEVTAVETFEIRDEEINVEEIMQKIRENIKRRKENPWPAGRTVEPLPADKTSCR